VEKLVTADSRDLLVLGESASQADSAYREAQSKVRTLQRQIAEAKSPDERRKVYEALATARDTMVNYKKQSDPLSSMSMGMAMMSMENRGDRKGKSTTRASEMPAPFNPGTLMSEFGGSDRASPSSGHTTPTVPQALALLNDPYTDIFGDRKTSSLAKRLFSLDSAEERLEFIFINLYSRHPTADETKRFAPIAKDEKSLRDLTRAMLTSNRFIFIQ
jgi:hypothetical protein